MNLHRWQRVGALAALSMSTASLAATLPEGMTKVDFSAGMSSSSTLWYQTATKVPIDLQLRRGEYFIDQQFDLGVTRGINEKTEVGVAIGFSNKNHIKADGSSASQTSGITFYTLRGKRSVFSSEEHGLDLTGGLEFKYANDVNQPWFFQSPNDRSHRLSASLDIGKALPWGGLYLFASPKLIYRTHAHPEQLEGTAGVVVPVSNAITVSGYYHVIKTAAGTDCFHDPRNYDQFHNLPYGPKLSDSHSGPGAVVSYGWDEHLTLEGFTYVKLDGMNTDKSATFGMNLSYVIF